MTRAMIHYLRTKVRFNDLYLPSGDYAVLNQATIPVQKREFSVANEYVYNRAGPVRWIISHLLRYPLFLTSFLIAATLTNVFFALIPRLTGAAFDEVLKPDASPQRLLIIALTILGLVLVRGLLDITNSWSVETLG